MRFSGRFALQVGAVGVVAGAILLPISAASGVTPPVTGPAITVTPSTGLTDGQSVTVTGTGFDASAPFAITECSALPPGATCDSVSPVQGTTSADGTIPSTPFTVKEGTIGTGTCPPAKATDTCYVVVTTDFATADPAKTGTAPISFAAAATPTVTVTPATGVKDGDSVTVSGTGFPASVAVQALECGTGATTIADCDVSTVKGGTTDVTGAFSGVAVTVHTGTVGDKTCDAGGTCAIVASTAATPADQTATNTGIGSFTFAAGSTPPPSKHHATKTRAKFSQQDSEIAGTVSSGGTGVKGLKTELEFKHGHKWKTVDTAKTHSGGAFAYQHVTKSGTYEVKTLKSSKFKGSTSNKITV